MKFLEEENTKISLSFVKSKDSAILITCLLILVISILNFFTSGSTVILADGKPAHPPIKNFCELVGDQMLKKRILPKTTDPSVYEVLTRNNYEILEFNGKENLLGVIANEELAVCSLLIRDDLGIRRIDMELDKSSLNYAYYKIKSVKEI